MANHPIVHFELNGSDRHSLATFYAKAFGWTIQKSSDMDCHTVNTGENNLGELIAEETEFTGTMLYLQCDDIRDSVARAEENGAEIIKPIESVPGDVTYAILRDPQGNRFGLVDAKAPE